MIDLVQIGKAGQRFTGISPADGRPDHRARARPQRGPDGPPELHRLFPPAGHRSRAHRRRAFLPRPPARRHRRARAGTDNLAARMTLCRRPALAPGSRRRRHPRRGDDDSRGGRGLRAHARVGGAAGRVRRTAGGHRPCARAGSIRARRPADPGLRASAAPAGRPAGGADPRAGKRPGGRPGRTARWRGRLGGWCRGLGKAADNERLAADRGSDARPRLPDSAVVKAVPILARTASLLAHLAEEREHPIGFLMAGRGGGAMSIRRRGT